MEYTVGEIGLKIKSTPSVAKVISIIRKYRYVSMAEIKAAIESGEYVVTCSCISHSGVKMIRKCYDELTKNGSEVEIYERDELISRDLISNLIASHRQTDREVEAAVDAEVAAEGEEE